MASALRPAESAVDVRRDAPNVTCFGPIESHNGWIRGEVLEYTPLVCSMNRTARTTELIAGRVDSSIASGKLRQILTDLATSAADLRRTTNTISAMANRLAGSQGHLDRFLLSGDSVLGKINAGQGTLGLLVNDSSLYIGSDSLVMQLRQLVTDIKANPKRSPVRPIVLISLHQGSSQD